MKLPIQIKKDLTGELRGDVLISDAIRYIYSTAACIYRIAPLAVVRPRDAQDVATTVKYAADNSIPVTPRGGGSGVAGHSVGAGIILDLMPYMRSVVAESDGWVEVQPGLILDKLNAHLAKNKMRFAPDPSSSPYCSIGGMIANNSSGARGIKFGSTRKHIESLEFVTADGKIVNTGAADAWITEKKNRVRNILDSNREIIASHKPKVTKNSSGYEMWDLFGDDGALDLARLVVGSEGTFGVVTKAKLRVIPAAARNGAILVGFRDLKHATESALNLRETDPSAIEVLDDSFLELLRNYRPDMSPMLPPRGQCLLLVEQEAETEDELRNRIERTESAARKSGAISVESAADPKGVARLWEIRKAGSPLISSMPGTKRPIRFVEDMVVPPERFAEFVGEFRKILNRYDCVAPVIGHAGDGNVHVNPLIDMSDPSAPKKIERIAGEVYELVEKFEGTPSGEHGDGRLRAPYLKNHFGKLMGVFESVKNIFDPKGVFNPGIILGDGKITDFMRPPPVYIETHGEMDAARSRESITRCHGCGLCRSVCPVFEISGAEDRSPRGRVALARGVAQGAIASEICGNDPEIKRIIETCLACGRCEKGCPTRVTPPAVISRAKELITDESFISLADEMLKNPRRWTPALSKMGGVGAAIQKLSRPVLNSNTIAGLLGFNPTRTAPFVKAPSLKILIGDNAVSDYDAIYFPGCYATFIDPMGIGVSTMRALEALGVKAVVATFACCGLPLLASGDRKGVRDTLAAALQPLIQAKTVPIITSCPSCATMLKGELFGLEPLAGQSEIARRVVGVEKYILNRLDKNSIAEPASPVSVAYHVSCHQKHIGDGPAASELLDAIGCASVEQLPDSCCGMGGAFGLRYRNKNVASDVGADLLKALKNSNADLALSDCGSCRIALSAEKQTAHPIEIISSKIKRHKP